jgi:N-methylhydantoinase A
MGILAGDRFLDGRMPLHDDLARAAFESLDTKLSLAQRVQYAWRMGLNNVAEGILDIAIRRGIDPRDFSLVAFGAAGPMLLPALLELIPLRRVIVPPHPGLFSALGLVSSDLVYSDHRSSYTLLTAQAAPAIDGLFSAMEEGLLARSGANADAAHFVRTFDGRLVGQSWETPFVDVPEGPITTDAVEEMVRSFHDTYERRNGNRFPAFPVQGVTWRVQLVVPTQKVEYEQVAAGNGQSPSAMGSIVIHHLYGDAVEATEIDRSGLRRGDRIEGPAVVREPMSTTFVPAGRVLTTGAYGELVIE